MRFEELSAGDAVGAILAHSHRLGPANMLKKGHLVTADDVSALTKAGVTRVSAVRLDPEDLDENAAAAAVAQAIAGRNVTIAKAATGRANIFAASRGVFVAPRARIDALNAVDEAITVATVPPYAVVEAGTMVATVKIIPFAVPAALVAKATPDAPLLSVAPFAKKRAGLIMTTLPGTREAQLANGSKAQHRRMAYLGGEIVKELRVTHDDAAVGGAIASLLDDGLDLILVLGASAIVDRRDVVPMAIEAVGGVVDHLGMPVDPGNLILIGHQNTTPIVGVPGCARSLKPSGFDWVLERLAANLPVGRAEMVSLGAGGLLAEVANRPFPRQVESEGETAPRVAAVVLAAGLSRRYGEPNKLLEPIAGVPIVVRTVDALLASKAKPVLVVVGHQADEVRAALEGRDVRFAYNPAYEEGLGASLRTGIEALGSDVDGALVALADMPWVQSSHIDTLIDAFDPKGPGSICVPVHDRKRGHPVLWSSRHFAEMKKLGGDVGARSILERHADAVQTVDVDDAAVHLDIDTPEMLAEATKTPV